MKVAFGLLALLALGHGLHSSLQDVLQTSRHGNSLLSLRGNLQSSLRPTLRRRSTHSSTFLKMHGGHDHNHAHSHEGASSIPLTLSQLGSLLQPRPKARLNLLLSSVIVLVPMLVRRRWPVKADFLFFLLSATVLTFFDSAKFTLKSYVEKVQRIQASLVRHSTPVFFKAENAADRVTLLGVVVNVLLSVSKFLGGIAFNSAVLVADAGHSLSDLLSDFICLWAVQVARLPADDDHPFGHGKFESVGSLFLSLTLLATGLSIGAWSYDKMVKVLQAQGLLNLGLRGVATAGGEGIVRAIHAGHAHGHAVAAAIRLPSWPALVLAGASIASKEWLFQVTRKVGEALNSQIIIANAWHHRSDAFSSVLSFGSIALAMTLPHLVFVDSAAGIFVAGMICLTGLDVLIESVKELVDTSDNSVAEDAKTAIMQVEGVLGVKSLRSRSVGSGRILVDVTIQTDKMMSFSAAQSIAEKAKWKVMTAMPSVMDVSVRTAATDDGVPYCPLLTDRQVSPAVAEENVRRAIAEAQATGASPALAPLVAVTRCTIYYMQTALLHADCFVRLDPRVSVEQAGGLADELSKKVVASKAVDSCAVFVDVGSAARPDVAPAGGSGGGEGQPLVSNPGLFVVAPRR